VSTAIRSPANAWAARPRPCAWRAPRSRGLAALDEVAEHRQARAVAVDLGEQRFAVLHRDVAPHLRRARGDPREVAKAARRESQDLGRVVARGDLGDERKGKDVRQVAHRGKDAVVVRGVRDRNAPAHRFPAASHRVQRFRRGLGHGREHDAGAAEKIGESRFHAARLAPGDGMARHEAPETLAQFLARDLHHLGLGAADVGHDRLVVHGERDIVQHRPHGAHGHGDHHEVGALHRFRNGFGRGIDGAQARGRFQRAAIAVESDDARGHAGAPQGEREGPADEAHADDRERLDAPHQACRARLSAARNRSFCSGRPTVTRRCFGKP